MNYQQFVSAVEEKVKKEMQTGMSVYVHTAMKNNGKNRVGITVTENGVNISPTIYLEEYFEQFQRNRPLEEIVSSILEVYREVKLEHSWETDVLRHYEKIRGKVVYKLVHMEKNRELLKTVPYIPYLDLAIVFYVLLEINLSGTATLLITDDILKLWGVKKERVYEDARVNTPKLLPVEFKTMKSVVAELMEDFQVTESEEDYMYVLTNNLRSFGATGILYENVLQEIGEKIGENYYVLPSSIHEVILVPESKSPSRIYLEKMIEEINDTQVEDEEVLSDRAYYFSIKENRLIL